MSSFDRKIKKLRRDPRAFVADGWRNRMTDLKRLQNPRDGDPLGLATTISKLWSRAAIGSSIQDKIASAHADHLAARRLRRNPLGDIVYLDVTRTMLRSGGWHTGITRVEFHYILHLLSRDDVQAFFVVQGAGDKIFLIDRERLVAHLVKLRWIQDARDVARKGDDASPIERAPSVAKFASAGLESLLLQRKLPPGIYLNVSHTGLEKELLYRRLRNTMGLTLGFYLHDLIPIDFPEYVADGDKQRHTLRMLTLLGFADFILVNSEATKSRFESFAHVHGGVHPELHTAIIGVEDFFLLDEEPRSAVKEDGHPYFLCVSTMEPRKNHLLLLTIWRRLAEERGESAPRLVIVGKRGWMNKDLFHFLDQSDACRRLVREYNSVDDRRLAELYRGAHALLFPSFVEGWGMPIAEAQSLNVPVVASDLPVFLEASQGLARLHDPLDGIGWYRTICELCDKPEVREMMVARLSKEFRAPSWKSHLAIVDRVLSAEYAPDLSRKEVG